MVSRTPVPRPGPSCAICGGELTWRCNNSILKEKRSWDDQQNVSCSAAEIDELYLQNQNQNQRTWLTLCRAIISRSIPDIKPSFELSGIRSGVEYNSDFYVPQSRDSALIGWNFDTPTSGAIMVHRADISTATTVMETSKIRGFPGFGPTLPDGYLIHARCWSLLEHVIGPVDDERLPFLVSALKRRFPEGSMGVDRVPHYLPGFKNPMIRPPKFYNFDPWKIPAVRDFLIKSREEMVSGSLASTPPLTQDNNPTILRHQLALLPLEIKLLILDQLGPDDAPNVIRAWNWVIPGSYWKFRFPRNLLFEIKSEDMNYPVDWMSLCCAAEQLIDESDGLRNRRRILNILEHTKKYYLDSLEVESGCI